MLMVEKRKMEKGKKKEEEEGKAKLEESSDATRGERVGTGRAHLDLRIGCAVRMCSSSRRCWQR